MTKEELISLLKNDEEIKDLIFNLVVNHRSFDSTIEETNRSNENASSWAEARGWT